MKELSELKFPENLRYAESHEWLGAEGGPRRSASRTTPRTSWGTSSTWSCPRWASLSPRPPLSAASSRSRRSPSSTCRSAGKVVEVNRALDGSPELVNNSPYDDGWMILVEPSDRRRGEAPPRPAQAYRRQTERMSDMRYLPHTPEDIAAMLARGRAPGPSTTSSPASRRSAAAAGPMVLPEPLTEWELNAPHRPAGRPHGRGTASTRCSSAPGSYDHHIPAAVGFLTSRSEFVTSYTPYQPEMSQGTLQAIFEYQTLTARLLGMEVANASMYDGASALAEALLMAVRITRRQKVAVSRAVHPHYRRVVRTYLAPTGYRGARDPLRPATAPPTSAALADAGDLAAVAVQSPNFFGCIEDLAAGRRPGARGRRASGRGLHRAAGLRALQEPRQPGRRHRLRRGPEPRHPALLRRPGPGHVRRQNAVHAQHARTAGRRNDGHRGPARLRADARHPRAAHPPREGDLQHLHQQQPLRADRRGLHGLPRRHRACGSSPRSTTTRRSI